MLIGKKVKGGFVMLGVIICVIGLFALLGVCGTITTEKFDKALFRQTEEWKK